MLNLIGKALKCLQRCLGIEDRKGTLRAGADADFVVFDEDGYVLSTWVDGKVVWNRSRELED
jgi:N-acetylglucosamine-6-phosphate deacetylase